ncbi:hypothetical protein Kisp02_69780 [Kineosporia sp. NBRC 101731]|nr:hypothetical protein Kisp02_69780 [Kineosporia sp. NBRC 101731]
MQEEGTAGYTTHFQCTRTAADGEHPENVDSRMLGFLDRHRGEPTLFERGWRSDRFAATEVGRREPDSAGIKS